MEILGNVGLMRRASRCVLGMLCNIYVAIRRRVTLLIVRLLPGQRHKTAAIVQDNSLADLDVQGALGVCVQDGETKQSWETKGAFFVVCFFFPQVEGGAQPRPGLR